VEGHYIYIYAMLPSGFTLIWRATTSSSSVVEMAVFDTRYRYNTWEKEKGMSVMTPDHFVRKAVFQFFRGATAVLVLSWLSVPKKPAKVESMPGQPLLVKRARRAQSQSSNPPHSSSSSSSALRSSFGLQNALVAAR
jgi:hypothetical protein